MQLFTIGYEGHSPESFVKLLSDRRVDQLVDVRQRAGSRKAGFSKTRLGETLTEHGIEYTHLPLLGTPADLRSRFKSGEMDQGSYLEAYRKYLAGQSGQIGELVELIRQQQCCLMCVERAPEECHRSILAAELAKRFDGKLAVRNL